MNAIWKLAIGLAFSTAASVMCMGQTNTTTINASGQVFLGTGLLQSAPSTTDIRSSAAVIIGGGGNFLSIGEAPNQAQWLQSSFVDPNDQVYSLSLNPLGGNVGGVTSIARPQGQVPSLAMQQYIKGWHRVSDPELPGFTVLESPSVALQNAR